MQLTMLRVCIILAACLLANSSGMKMRAANGKSMGEGVDPTGGSIPEQDLIDMITSLIEVVSGLDKEQDAFTSISEAREKTCQDLQHSLGQSQREGERTLQTATNELSQAQSEVQSIQGFIDTVQTEIKALETWISDLQTELARLRANRASALERDSGVHLEVEAILKRAEERINKVWKRTNVAEEMTQTSAAEEDVPTEEQPAETQPAEGSAGLLLGTAAMSQVDELKELEDSFSLSPPSFMQLEVDESIFSVSHEGRRSFFHTARSEEELANETNAAAEEGTKALKKDADDMQKAAKDDRKAFELEELRIMNMIKEKHTELEPLDAQLLERQPELSEQLRKSAEAKRTVAMATKGIGRDKSVLARLQTKCQLLSEAKEWEKNKRPHGREQIVLAVKLLTAIADTRGIVLPPAAQSAGGAQKEAGVTEEASTVQKTSFLQLESSHDSSSGDLSEAVRSALRNMMAVRGGTIIDELGGNGAMTTGSFGAAMSASSTPSQVLLQAGSETESTAAEKAEGTDVDPLKPVKEIISSLVASLREEQNEEKTKQNFCAEQRQKARVQDNALKSEVGDASEKTRWNENAVLDLQADISWLTTDSSKLEHAIAAGKDDLNSEIARISAEAENHETAANITNRAQKVLLTYCGQAAGKEEVQAESDLTAGNCKEADQALKKGNDFIAQLDQYLSDYLIKLTNVTQEHKEEMKQTLKVHQASLFQSQTDLNKRQDERAQAAFDLLNAKQKLMLAAKASAKLETICSPKLTKMEDVIERYKQQIDELKRAIRAIDGSVL